MASELSATPSDLPPGLASPARRALAGAGYQRLDQVAAVTAAEIRHLHGIGPNALKQLRSALAARGLSFADDAPGPPAAPPGS